VREDHCHEVDSGPSLGLSMAYEMGRTKCDDADPNDEQDRREGR
jgi:hypothetical protein